MDLKRFSLFSRLPAEIRVTIWSQLFTPHVVYINPISIPAHHARIREDPILLRVCHESRSEALRQYELVGCRYVSFRIDTIYLAYGHETEPLDIISPIPREEGILFLAIEVESFLRTGLEIVEKMHRWQHLREIKIVTKIKKSKESEIVIAEAKGGGDFEDAVLANIFRDISEVVCGDTLVDQWSWPNLVLVAIPSSRIMELK